MFDFVELLQSRQISSKKQTKTCRIVVKTNSFVHFLEEFMAWKFAFEIIWPLVPSLFPLLGMPATDRCYQLNEDGFMLFAQMRKKRFSASSVVYNNTIWITGV